MTQILVQLRIWWLRYRIDTAEAELSEIHPLDLHPLQMIRHRVAITRWTIELNAIGGNV